MTVQTSTKYTRELLHATIEWIVFDTRNLCLAKVHLWMSGLELLDCLAKRLRLDSVCASTVMTYLQLFLLV